MISKTESEMSERDLTQYAAPKLTIFGTIEALTLAALEGPKEDGFGGLGPPDGGGS